VEHLDGRDAQLAFGCSDVLQWRAARRRLSLLAVIPLIIVQYQ